ncbi:MAG: AAA family ATPase, partial [Anaerolineae bacterium]
MTDHTEEVEHWRKLLEQHRSNLRKQREQQAVYARGEERLALLTQIVASEDAVREAKANLHQLGVDPGSSTIDPPEVFQPFAGHLVKAYPLPIAQACADFNQAQELGRRFVALDRLITHLIKYLAAIFIGQARRDKPDDYPLPQRLEWLATPTLESWTDAIYNLSQLYQESLWREKWRFDGLLYACTRSLLGRQELVDAIDYLTLQLDRSAIDEPSIIDFLRLLAWYREGEWEDAAAQYPSDKIEPLMLRLQPALTVVLNELEPLRRHPLVYVERADAVDSEVRLRLVKFMGQFTEDKPSPNKPPLTMPEADAQHIKRKRFYVAGDGDIPQLDLHPFFVLYRWELYQLERHGPTDFVEFRSCTRGKRFRPPQEARTFFASWWEAQPQEAPAEDVPPVLGEEENWYDKVEPIPSDELVESVPLTWLNPEGREALEIALGEALRIGHFWLGIEFLLMGLSKQLGRAFPTVLREMGIHPGEFRGLLRGWVGVATEKDWRQMDVRVLGAEALPQIQTVDPDALRKSFDAAGDQSPVITPRMMVILETAVQLSGEGQVGHNHLLLAALRHYQSLAIQLLFAQASEAGWHAEQVMTRLAEVAGAEPNDLIGDAPESPDAPGPRHAQSPPFVRRRPPGGSVLTKFGRDLTQAAQEGKIGPAEGENARRAMTQIGRILLQSEANNPIILGDPGVGKTAVVEGFAWRLAGRGKGAHERLAGRRVVELSTSDLLAGTKYRGDLEERLQRLLAEVKAGDGQVIVFIDEIHGILGGGTSGGLSAIADALKPALSRGEFPCIGATTVAEYRK